MSQDRRQSGVALIVAGHGVGSSTSVGELQVGGYVLMRDAPSDEHSGDAAGGRPGGEPGVDVGLCRLR
ncbi:hypothetical protein KZ288_29140, partial [Escherichia coli]|nr:hypothetical protein [Escherichia coli]